MLLIKNTETLKIKSLPKEEEKRKTVTNIFIHQIHSYFYYYSIFGSKNLKSNIDAAVCLLIQLFKRVFINTDHHLKIALKPLVNFLVTYTSLNENSSQNTVLFPLQWQLLMTVI